MRKALPIPIFYRALH